MSKQELLKLFYIIKQAHQMFSISDDKISVWLDLLEETTYEEAHANLRHHLKSSSRMPAPADLIQIQS